MYEMTLMAGYHSFFFFRLVFKSRILDVITTSEVTSANILSSWQLTFGLYFCRRNRGSVLVFILHITHSLQRSGQLKIEFFRVVSD